MRILLSILFNAVALYATALVVPGISFHGNWVMLLGAGGRFGLFTPYVRPGASGWEAGGRGGWRWAGVGLRGGGGRGNGAAILRVQRGQPAGGLVAVLARHLEIADDPRRRVAVDVLEGLPHVRDRAHLRSDL